MTADRILPLVLVLHGCLLWLIPTLSRPGIFFGVTVPPEFSSGPEARAILRRYRVILIAAVVIGLIAMQRVSSPYLKMGILALDTLVALAAWVGTHRAAGSFAAPVSHVRSAALTRRDASVPGGVLALAGPFVILAAAAALLYAQWDLIPERVPTRWNLDGTPQRFTGRSLRSVFGNLVFCAVLLAAFTTQTLMLLRRTRQIAAAGAAADAEVRFKHRSVLMSVGASYVLAIGAALVSTLGALATGGSLGAGMWFWLGVVVIWTVGLTAWMLWVGQGGQRRVPSRDAASATGDATPDAAWKGGLLYFNPADPAVFVEKRMGVGWTLNLGNAWAWVLLALAFAGPWVVLRLLG